MPNTQIFPPIATAYVSVVGIANVEDVADGTTGSSVPPFTMQVGGSDGTNLRTLKTDSNGQLQITVNSDTSPATLTVQDILLLLLLEVRAMKTAIISLDNTIDVKDFQANDFMDNAAGLV